VVPINIKEETLLTWTLDNIESEEKFDCHLFFETALKFPLDNQHVTVVKEKGKTIITVEIDSEKRSITLAPGESIKSIISDFTQLWEWISDKKISDEEISDKKIKEYHTINNRVTFEIGLFYMTHPTMRENGTLKIG
jgi:hypothetical protein